MAKKKAKFSIKKLFQGKLIALNFIVFVIGTLRYLDYFMLPLWILPGMALVNLISLIYITHSNLTK